MLAGLFVCVKAVPKGRAEERAQLCVWSLRFSMRGADDLHVCELKWNAEQLANGNNRNAMTVSVLSVRMWCDQENGTTSSETVIEKTFRKL